MKKSARAMMLLMSCLLLSACGKRETSIKLPDADQVVTVQWDLIKAEAGQWGRERIEKMIESLEDMVALDRKEAAALSQEKYDITISLIYDDATRDVFYFFQSGDDWYMKAQNGAVYQDADFITDYVQYSNTESDTVLEKLPKEMLELAKSFEEPDIRFAFSSMVLKKLKSSVPEEDAIKSVREKMKEDMLLYQYALQNGYGLTEEEAKQSMAQRIAEYENAGNYMEIEDYFEASGISVKEYYQRFREDILVQDTIAHLYILKCEEFKSNDKIGDKVCQNIREYWNAFLNEIVYLEMQNYDSGEFMEQLDLAEEYYREDINEISCYK